MPSAEYLPIASVRVKKLPVDFDILSRIHIS